MAASPIARVYHALAGAGNKLRVLLVPMLLLAGCDQRPDKAVMVNDSSIDNSALPPPPPVKALSPSENAADTAEADGALPAGMIGSWVGVDERCGERAAVLGLVVDPGKLRFYESEGVVQQVRRLDDHAVTADIAYSGEGQSWVRTQKLSLSPDGRRLTISGMGSDVIRKRCS